MCYCMHIDGNRPPIFFSQKQHRSSFVPENNVGVDPSKMGIFELSRFIQGLHQGNKPDEAERGMSELRRRAEVHRPLPVHYDEECVWGV